MSYFKPYIDEKGFHMPTYNDVLGALVQEAQRIFGPGVYLGTDSQDYQLIATFAEFIHDATSLAQSVYNQFSPSTASGAGLDQLVAINGIARKTATRSTVTMLLWGEPGTVMKNLAVSDGAGQVFDIPDAVTLDDLGLAEATAVCRTPGLISAMPDTITTILTPMLGLVGVTNPREAIPGRIAESDPELRGRRMLSVAQPSRSILDGLRGGLAAVPDVARSVVFENDTEHTDANGLPPKSLCAVLEGGDEGEIARTIYAKKTPGCMTHGDIVVAVPDSAGRMTPIRFMRPAYVAVDVEIVIRKKAHYAPDTPSAIKGAIVNYLDRFDIGHDLTVSILWMVAQSVNEDYLNPSFSVESVKAARRGSAPGTGDIPFAFYEVARGNPLTISITEQ